MSSNCYQNTVRQHCNFQQNSPPFVSMSAVEDQNLLAKEHEHVEEASKVADSAFTGMVPEGEDGGPSDVVAVIFNQKFSHALIQPQMSEKETSFWRFKSCDNSKHNSNGCLAHGFRCVLSKSIVPNICLQNVIDTEKEVSPE